MHETIPDSSDRNHHHNRLLTPEAQLLAANALEAALAENPDDSLLLALMADMCATPHFMGYVDDISSLRQAETLARRDAPDRP